MVARSAYSFIFKQRYLIKENVLPKQSERKIRAIKDNAMKIMTSCNQCSIISFRITTFYDLSYITLFSRISASLISANPDINVRALPPRSWVRDEIVISARYLAEPIYGRSRLSNLLVIAELFIQRSSIHGARTYDRRLNPMVIHRPSNKRTGGGSRSNASRVFAQPSLMRSHHPRPFLFFLFARERDARILPVCATSA